MAYKNRLILLILAFSISYGLDFSTIKKGQENNNTILIIGGIQGDEPGGFNAANLIAKNYTITKGSVWVVPNLNFLSIIKRSRGVYGDMNRKFATISKKDPEYEIINKIKNLIKNDQVSLVLNLHDGSGFYRKKYINKNKNPYRWGQSIIIDQSILNFETRYKNLEKIALQVVASANEYLIHKEHIVGVKNTKTKEGDKEMEKTLTYFAINNKKPAFGLEVSKSFSTHLRAYYHLLYVEEFFRIAGIEFEKDFDLSPLQVKASINKDLQVNINETIALDLKNSRSVLRYFPTDKKNNIKLQSNNALLVMTKNKNSFNVYYGNRRVSLVKPQYFNFDYSLKNITMQVDGKEKEIKIGSIVKVEDSFLVKSLNGYRVNVIGFVSKNKKDESDVLLKKKNFLKYHSIDKKGSKFRIEIYKKETNKFAGMVLVNFSKEKKIALNK